MAKYFEQNSDIVITTLERYRYGPRAVSLSMNCYDSLFKYMESSGIICFSPAQAYAWCQSEVPKHIREQSMRAIQRLVDVYKNGRVLGCHLKVYPDPSEAFQQDIDTYIARLEDAGRYTTCHIRNIRHVVTQFCCFVQYNGTEGIENVDFNMLEMYDRYLRESSRAYFINEGLVVRFLEYLSAAGRCRQSFPLYMHYLESSRCTSISSMKDETQKEIESFRTESMDFPADEFFRTFSDFTGRLSNARYSESVINCSRYHLTLLYLFLERSGLGYDHRIAEVWLDECGRQIFGTAFAAARRTLDMYKDYVQEGDVIPLHRRNPRSGKYDNLPGWCRAALDLFLQAKEKEGWTKSTVNMYRACNTSFCGFLADSGVSSFSGLTPAVIKDFNVHDNRHKTPESKNAYNSRIREFLIFLEMKNLITSGLHFSLPNRACGGTKIVETLSSDDKSAIEAYCAAAETPLALRDAAMLMIAINLGLRSCDIAGLLITDINWKELPQSVPKEDGHGNLPSDRYPHM